MGESQAWLDTGIHLHFSLESRYLAAFLISEKTDQTEALTPFEGPAGELQHRSAEKIIYSILITCQLIGWESDIFLFIVIFIAIFIILIYFSSL